MSSDVVSFHTFSSYICQSSITKIEETGGYLITESVVAITLRFSAQKEEISFRLEKRGEVQM